MQLRQFLDDFPIVPLSKGMEEIAAQVKVDRQRAGRTMETADVWIAATALYHDVPLVTHDEDFVDTPGLRIITASPSVSEVRAKLPVTIRPDLLPDMRCRCSL
jgi:tRNA(fMet)-specific endonuclease VapC